MRAFLFTAGVLVAAALALLATGADAGNPQQIYGYYELYDSHAQKNQWEARLSYREIMPCPFGTALRNLMIVVSYLTENTIEIAITDADAKRWAVPDITLPIGPPSAPLNFDVQLKGSPFAINVTRTTGEVVFASNGLFFSDQFIVWGTVLPHQANIYGLGERTGSLRFDTSKQQTFSFIASDQGTPLEKPLYGSHPFWMEVRKTPTGSQTHGAFLLNSNAMDVDIGPNALTFKTTGGLIDFFVFMGPTPDDVIKQYHALIGTPYLPPLWSLGYHQCRWGYKNLSMLQDVIDNFARYDLPVDTFWVDIDYMDRWKVFTTDPVNFAQPAFKALVDSLHANGQHFVPIIDPGVRVQTGYPAYDDGLLKQVFVRDPTGAQFQVGKVWPGFVLFPDWTHPNTPGWWAEHVKAFHDQVPIDGMWTDMNEVANFCDGRCRMLPSDDLHYPPDQRLFQCNCTKDLRWDNGTLNDPPYAPKQIRDRQCRSITGDIHGLDCATLSMASRHYLGLEYNLHNLYGHFEVVATTSAMRSIRQKRAFVLSRSTFPGTGRYSAHWLGDNTSQWPDLKLSIAGILNFNFFGVPLVGADICGFAGTTTPELCLRWMQVGAFYPFSRNHNVENSPSQEPYALGPLVLESSRKALRLRYQLMPMLYTAFAEAHRKGGVVAMPLFYEYPDDPATYGNDEQFILGKAILVSPVLRQGFNNVTAYFPKDDWYSIYTGEHTISASAPQRSLLLQTPPDMIQVHVRGGRIVPMRAPALTTTAQQGTPYQLLVVMQDNEAKGPLYVDDGEDLYTIENGTYSSVFLYANSSKSGITVTGQRIDGAGRLPIVISDVKVWGFGAANLPANCTSPFFNVTLNGVVVSGMQISLSASAFSVTGLSASIPVSLSESWVLQLACGHAGPNPPDDGGSSGLSKTQLALIIAGSLFGAAVITYALFAFARKRRGGGTDFAALPDNGYGST